MSTIGELAVTLNEATFDFFNEDERQSLLEVLDFLDSVPQDLDLASAAYYLKKEFKANNTGVDDRYAAEIYTADAEVYDEWDDDDDDYVDDYYCCEDCG